VGKITVAARDAAAEGCIVLRELAFG